MAQVSQNTASPPWRKSGKAHEAATADSISGAHGGALLRTAHPIAAGCGRHHPGPCRVCPHLPLRGVGPGIAYPCLGRGHREPGCRGALPRAPLQYRQGARRPLAGVPAVRVSQVRQRRCGTGRRAPRPLGFCTGGAVRVQCPGHSRRSRRRWQAGRHRIPRQQLPKRVHCTPLRRYGGQGAQPKPQRAPLGPGTTRRCGFAKRCRAPARRRDTTAQWGTGAALGRRTVEAPGPKRWDRVPTACTTGWNSLPAASNSWGQACAPWTASAPTTAS